MNPWHLAAALLVIPVILASGCTSEQPIGGETDEHGCMLMAGYTWCEAKQKCLRTWVEPCEPYDLEGCNSSCKEQGYSVGHCMWPSEIWEDDVFMGSCLIPQSRHCGNEGQCNCYCKYEAPPEEIEDTYSPQECIDLGGRPVNIVGGDYCYENETNIGRVVGFISPNICCVPFPESKRLTLEQAMEAAEGSGCMEMGSLTDSYVYNPNSHTWWIDMDMKPEFAKDYCSPACVVSEETGEAEINWRCTGALP